MPYAQEPARSTCLAEIPPNSLAAWAFCQPPLTPIPIPKEKIEILPAFVLLCIAKTLKEGTLPMLRSCALAGLAALILHGSAAGTPIFVPISTPGSTTVCCGIYTSATNVFALPGTDETLFNNLTSGSETLTFSTQFMRLSVPTTWNSWSSPPQSETSTPDVAWSNFQNSATLTLSAPVAIFGFELEPTYSGVHQYTVGFLNGSTPLGSIVLSPSGDAGALLFAGEVSGAPNLNLIDTVTISGDSDFALANIRYGEVPEPASLLLVLAGGLMIAGRRILASTSRR